MSPEENATDMSIFQIVFIIAVLLCSLTAGFLLGFAVVVMPGLKRLSDSEYLKAFQAIDGIIQDGQPLFMLMWVGSVILLVISVVLGIGHLESPERLYLILATLVYLFGVHVPTIAVNIPMNNALKNMNIDALSEQDVRNAREDFEPRWNRWNRIRTMFSIFTVVLLIVLLLMI